MSDSQNLLQHEFITTNGVRLHYVTRGEGELMLMLHGFPEFWYSWRHQISEFAKNYRVVALDMRGYNLSDKPQATSAYVISELVKDIEGVIKGLGYQKCILVGHDWGGAIAWHFAYAYPEMLDKLIVMNIPHPARFAQAILTNPEQMLRSWYILAFQIPWLPELFFQANDYRAIANAFINMAVDKNAFTSEDLEAYRRAAAQPGALTAMLNYYRSLFPHFLFEQRQWGRLDVPTLMIWGEEDTALSKLMTYNTEAYVSNFQIRYIPHCSHWVQQEQPQLVNQYMQEFLS